MGQPPTLGVQYGPVVLPIVQQVKLITQRFPCLCAEQQFGASLESAVVERVPPGDSIVLLGELQCEMCRVSLQLFAYLLNYLHTIC